MASEQEKGKYRYSETDKVDAYLLNQVIKHVNHEELDSLARDLFVDESIYENIQNPKNRAYKVCEDVFFRTNKNCSRKCSMVK